MAEHFETGGTAVCPAITIVTATLNAVEPIAHTIRSLTDQTLKDFEWIVIDGGSTDGTLTRLRQVAGLSLRCWSEPDDGIYHAWNTACELARGQWLLFLGAGDELAAPDVIERALPLLRTLPGADTMAYGRIQLIEPGSRRLLEERGASWDEMAGRWTLFRPELPIHPEVFHRASLFAAGERFDTRYRFAADTDFLLRQAAIRPFRQLPLVVTRMEYGGHTGRLPTLRAVSRETRAIARDHGYRAPLGHRIRQHIKLAMADLPTRLLPGSLTQWLETGYRRARAGWRG